MASLSAPEIPVVNAGSLYINGLKLSVLQTANQYILDVTSGSCRDSSNTNDIVLQNYTQVNINTVGLNGVDIANFTGPDMLAVYAIGSSVKPALTLTAGTGTPVYYQYSAAPAGIILSQNFTAPIMPFGYDMFRRIGAITVDHLYAIERFVQIGNGSTRTMLYGNTSNYEVLNAGSSTVYTPVPLNDISQSVPPAASINVLFHAYYIPFVAGGSFNLEPGNGFGADVYALYSSPVAGVSVNAMIQCPCSPYNNSPTSSNINYKVSGGDQLTLWVAGYQDEL